MAMRTRPVRPTLLLQALALIASVALFGSVALLLLRAASIWMVVVVPVAWVVAIELDLLPALVEWWAVRHAARHGGILRSRLFTYDAEAADARRREGGRADVDGNPSLW
jgi:hypothetical protein